MTSVVCKILALISKRERIECISERIVSQIFTPVTDYSISHIKHTVTIFDIYISKMCLLREFYNL